LKKTLEAKLEASGWIVECELPLEIRHEDGSFVTGQAARHLLDEFRDTPTGMGI